MLKVTKGEVYMQRYTDFETIEKEIGDRFKEGPPNCFDVMKPRLVEYLKGKRLTVAFPVLEQYLNPAKRMQGGFITAAFDNVFGSLCIYETNGSPVATIDISTTFLRPIFLDEALIITAFIKSKGKTLVHMCGEAKNREGKLIATSTTNLILLDNKNK